MREKRVKRQLGEFSWECFQLFCYKYLSCYFLHKKIPSYMYIYRRGGNVANHAFVLRKWYSYTWESRLESLEELFYLYATQYTTSLL